MSAPTFRTAVCTDVSRCFQIETSAYEGDEAATREKIATRIDQYPQGFLVMQLDGEIIGFINGGCAYDVAMSDEAFKELVGHDPDAPNVVILSVAIDPAHQGKGYASLMMRAFVERMRAMGKRAIHLMCKERHIELYARMGYRYVKPSASGHGGMAWHEMVMHMPLTIGIAACSSEGAALCYKTLCTRAPQFLGPHAHPDIVLHSSSLAEYVAALERGDLAGVARLMLRAAQRLADAGADFVICPDNTIHAAYGLMCEASPLPWLHIAEVVATQAQRRGVRQAAILGTEWLMASDVYPRVLSKFDIRHQVPEPPERKEIGRIIMDELVNGVQNPASVQYLQDVIARMKARGCDAVILGCTELPIVLGEANSSLPTLDSTRLLADAAIQHAISHCNSMSAARKRK